MARQQLTDGSGKWFDLATATAWEEKTHWDGSNHISLATGSQWNHEVLYRTGGGRFILHKWSQWQGRPSTFEEISGNTGWDWLIRNEYFDAVPEEKLKAREV